MILHRVNYEVTAKIIKIIIQKRQIPFNFLYIITVTLILLTFHENYLQVVTCSFM